MKKKMYYNMRIKTMQRTFSTLNKLLKKAKKIKRFKLFTFINFRDSLAEDIGNINVKVSELASELVQKKEVLKEL